MAVQQSPDKRVAVEGVLGRLFVPSLKILARFLGSVFSGHLAPPAGNHIEDTTTMNSELGMRN
jgi:hypothetical protein